MSGTDPDIEILETEAPPDHPGHRRSFGSLSRSR